MRQFVATLPASIRRDGFLIAIIVAYWICGLVVAHFAGLPPEATVTTYLATYIPMTAFMLVSLILGRGAMIMIHDHPARPLRQLIREIPTMATPQRVAYALPMLAGMLLFGGTFTVMKATIQHFEPFTWDTTFEQWDRWLHGGVAPWQLLQPMLGHPPVTRALDWLYDLWFYILSLIWVWQAFSQHNDRLRLQFFLTMLLGWILLGNIAAMLMSSGGPCFFGRITGLPDPYDPLLYYLADADRVNTIFAVEAQRVLWQVYILRALTLGAGISAMPSMHVALAILFALVCWRVRRSAGIVMTIYAIIVMVASVQLAWHYAVDGYIGAIGIVAIWWVVGWALTRQDRARRRGAVTHAV
jgi:hypothetical protein